MAVSKHRTAWMAVAAAAVGVGAWYFVTHRFQVYVVRTGKPGVATFAATYTRDPSKWFSSKQAAMDFAAGQMGGVDFVGAFVATRSNGTDGVLDVFHGHFLTGEEIDAIINQAEGAGSMLWGKAA
jgi:hypothetical protein